MKTRVKKKEIKKTTITKPTSKMGLYIQVGITILAIVLIIMSFFNQQFILYVKFAVALDMFVIAYNNKIIYKRNYFTIFYIVIGLAIIGITIYQMIRG